MSFCGAKEAKKSVLFNLKEQFNIPKAKIENKTIASFSKINFLKVKKVNNKKITQEKRMT